MRQVQLTLEGDMQLLCVTGVEDKLQPDVRTSLEMLANAGIKVIRSNRIELLHHENEKLLKKIAVKLLVAVNTLK